MTLATAGALVFMAFAQAAPPAPADVRCGVCWKAKGSACIQSRAETVQYRRDSLDRLLRTPARCAQPCHRARHRTRGPFRTGSRSARRLLTNAANLWSLPTGVLSARSPDTENAPFFNRPQRDQEEKPELLMSALQLRRGASVADVGSGTGYFTWRLAEEVGPKGKVYAVDVQQSMLDLTRKTVAAHKLSNVEYVLRL